MIYIEISKLNIADMWLIPLDRVTNLELFWEASLRMFLQSLGPLPENIIEYYWDPLTHHPTQYITCNDLIMPYLWNNILLNQTHFS